MIIRENYLKTLRDLKDTDFIKVITGIRRSGKTFLLKSFIDELKKDIPNENIIYIPLEDENYINIRNIEELSNIVKNLSKGVSGKLYMFFDEIQLVNDWEKIINAFRVSYDCDIYITGSNSKLLTGELATLLSGRFIQIKVYPFSFNEILQYKHEIEGINLNKENERQIFQEYLKYGGMPGLLQLNNEEYKKLALKDMYSTIVLNDILNRSPIIKINFLQNLLNYLIETVGNVFSSRSIYGYFKNKTIKTSKDTISSYVHYIENSYFIILCKQAKIEGKELLNPSQKYYLMDQGFHQAIIGNNEGVISGILENIIFVELLRRGYEVTIGNIGKNNYEVDFVCNKDDKIVYVQVTYLLASEKTIEREFGSLLMIRDNYDKYVLSMDEFDFSRKGIKHMNIIDFLKDDTI